MNTIIDFNDALKAAKRSTIRKFQTGAAIYDRHGNLLATGCSHVPEFRLCSTPWSRHAESDALRRCHNLNDAHTIVIATISRKSGNVTSGKPCPACAKELSRTPIRDIVYTQRIED